MTAIIHYRFVLSRILQPLETADPFAEDFYYLQLGLKRAAEAHERARYGMGPPPAAPFTVPLPTWKDTKLRIKVRLHS